MSFLAHKSPSARSFLLVFAVGLSLVQGSFCLPTRNSIQYRHDAATLKQTRDVQRVFQRPFSTNPLVLRGGGFRNASSARKLKSQDAATEVSAGVYKTLRATFWTALIASVSYLVWENRVSLMQMFSKQKLQDSILEILERIQSGGTNKGLLIYTAGMTVWEMIGLNTIPVETAAGMAFGFRDALIASAVGKLIGAVWAFLMGRLLLGEWVKKKLQDNTVMQLVDGSAENHPLRNALLFKFSCFPEFIKNYGTAVVKPVQLWMFVFATVVHGWPYSALWTYLGDDTVARMQDDTLATNRRLQVLLVVAAVIGIIGSPALMAWWVRDLKKQSDMTKGKRRNKR